MKIKVIIAAIAAATSTAALAQAVGFATLPPGSLNHTTASAVAKTLKERAGINMLVQPTAGDNVIIPMVNRGESTMGIANAPETAMAIKEAKQGDVRLLAVAHTLQTAFFVRKDSSLKTIADMKGKRVALGYSAMRTIDLLTRAMLATAGLTERDVQAVRVPNVVRSADDFASGAADMFFFAFGGPKVREVDASIPLRVLEIDEKGMAAARKVTPYGFLTQVQPGPIFIGVEKPMKVYSFDNLFLVNAKVSDDMVYKILDTLEKNKADLVAVQPVLRAFSAANGYKKYDMPYHPGALKYYKEHNIQAKSLE
ncbi:MAG TPA: TAXI family TRAP transporter solute-binding subunit [Burkholderiales bacterium]|nr:TAXI family TRAP transporter solute-binding subunit [Burkholderiales bacterium]